MIVVDILYNIFIMPLELVFEVVFRGFQSHPALGIVAISIVMNFLALPLYKRADAIQAEERDKTAAMKPMLDIIRQAFKGDERYMVTTTYYRQQGYKPVYALRSTFPLLLQVPFFIAAYHYLSNLKLLRGISFFVFKDLGRPDGLLNFGSFSVNVLPIIMTLINVISAYIYLKGFPLKDKIQTYGIAAIFLVLLYDSPSGLVFYWTLNQVFSVLKNVFMKLVGPKLRRKDKKSRKEVKSLPLACFIAGALFDSAFLGLVIPSAVIGSSPTEFMKGAFSPASLIISAFCTALGFFLVWIGIYYYMSKPRLRNIFTYALWVIAGVSAVNYFVFPGNPGNMSKYLIFDNTPQYETKEKLINLIVMAVLVIALILVMKFAGRFIPFVYAALIAGCVIMTVVSAVNISGTISKAEESMGNSRVQGEEKIIHLSREGKNVLVIMLDRALGGEFPLLLEEKPELKEKFDGFTYYSNNISFGMCTNYAAPAVFGGYEYTPSEMNKRDGERLKDKHNESLKLLPVLFAENGYKVSVCDPPYANYEYVPDLSIYDGVKNISAYITRGAFNDKVPMDGEDALSKNQKRNFFFYSIFRAVPTALKAFVYDRGNYLSAEGIAGNDAWPDEFLNDYAVLYSLPEITEIEENGDNFLMLQNETTHNPWYLKTPEYIPSLEARAPQGDENQFNQAIHFQANMAAMLQLGKWFDFMRANGVYDNTRIVIVSDHGRPMGQFKDLMGIPGDDLDRIEGLYALLLFKDFNGRGYKESRDFMTTADTPALAVGGGLMPHPRNPFTGKEINSDAKTKTGEVIVSTSTNYMLADNNGNTFVDDPDGRWWKVGHDIHKKENWKPVRDHKPETGPHR